MNYSKENFDAIYEALKALTRYVFFNSEPHSEGDNLVIMANQALNKAEGK